VADDRLDQVYSMVTNLIQIVGHTNAMVEEVRVGQEELRKGQEELRGKVNELYEGQEELRKDVKELRQGQVRIEQKVDTLIDNQAGIFEMLGDHDVAVRTWRKERRALRPTSPP